MAKISYGYRKIYGGKFAVFEIHNDKLVCNLVSPIFDTESEAEAFTNLMSLEGGNLDPANSGQGDNW